MMRTSFSVVAVPSKTETTLGAVMLVSVASFVTYMVMATINKPVEEASVSARHIVLLLAFIAVVASTTLLWVVIG